MQASIGQTNPFGTGPFPPAWEAATTPPNDSSSPSTSSSSSSAADGSATITANDFLQLLVTEMQNQDPTANTDPNEYISQLVQVNSLEQLVQINQDLGSSSSASTSSDASGAISLPSPDAASAGSGDAQTGNLTKPAVSAAAGRVAHSLQYPSAASLQTPSAAALPAELQNLVHARGAHAGVVHTTNSTAR
ncbi:MAG TPA: flagellar hook capping FlgD N-terminal domain-containing protein [Acidobacteriaceae bacterium]|jgi:flagellar basal-body rod modification protein FlgD|nr:flagellar hook capping FlgD N-terminal domain-containing protein [Acidobacteriaceae bacterium]